MQIPENTCAENCTSRSLRTSYSLSKLPFDTAVELMNSQMVGNRTLSDVIVEVLDTNVV